MSSSQNRSLDELGARARQLVAQGDYPRAWQALEAYLRQARSEMERPDAAQCARSICSFLKSLRVEFIAGRAHLALRHQSLAARRGYLPAEGVRSAWEIRA